MVGVPLSFDPSPRPRFVRAALGLATVVLPAALGLKQLADVDGWYHLAYGRELLAGGRFPPGEPFLAPLLGQGGEYRTPEWLFAVLVRAAEQVGGLPAVSVLVALLAALTFIVLWRDRTESTQDTTAGLMARAAVLMLAAVLMRERFQPRPEIVAFLLISLVQHAIHRHEEGEWRPLAALPLLFIVWANIHPSQVVGLGLLGLHALALLAGVGWKRLQGERPGWRALRPAMAPALVAVAGVAASFVAATPGVGLATSVRFLATILGGGPAPGASDGGAAAPALTHFVSELAAPGRDDLLGLQGGFICLVAASFAVNARHVSASALARAAAACAASLVAVRFIPLLPLICAPLVARNLAEVAARGRVRAALACALPLLLAPLAAPQVARFTDERFGVGLLPGRFPEGSLGQLENLHLAGPVYHTIHFGGFIAWRAVPGVRPFHDARNPESWAGPDAALAPFDEAAFGRLDTRYAFAAAILETVLAPDEQTLARLAPGLQAPAFGGSRFALVHFDDAAGLYLRRDLAPVPSGPPAEYRCVRPDHGLELMSLRSSDPALGEACLDEARRAVAASPRAAIPRLFLGRALLDRGDLAGAEEQLVRARRAAFAPLRCIIDGERARGAWLAGDAARSCGLLEEAGAHGATRPRAAVLAGAACLGGRGTRPAATEPWFRQALKGDPELLGAYHGLLKVAPTSPRAPTYRQFSGMLEAQHQGDEDLRRGADALQQGDHAAAAAHLRRVVERNPRNVLGHTNLGFALLSQGHVPEASVAFQRAASLDPFHPEAEYGLGLVFERLGHREAAAARLRRFVELRPTGRFADRARVQLQAWEGRPQPQSAPTHPR
ncbi:MAG: tetratricopeptide repeat protein [Deltaproteobacteria bacterium]|nr:tetratricopeptide repeat protein [Deltaproteobacteria bacterium]